MTRASRPLAPMAAAAVLPMLLVAGCVPAPRSAPAPRPAASPPPTQVAPPATTDWRDVPLTPGRWAYRPGAAGSAALFVDTAGRTLFALRCAPAERRVTLERAGVNDGAGAGTMTVTTSYGAASWPAAAGAGGAIVTLAAADPALDRMAFSRGRFTVATPGLPDLVLPSWAEPGRVIEDCRG